MLKLLLAPFRIVFNLCLYLIIGPFWLMWMLCRAISGRK